MNTYNENSMRKGYFQLNECYLVLGKNLNNDETDKNALNEDFLNEITFTIPIQFKTLKDAHYAM